LRRRSNRQGFSLIEVLVATVIMAVAVSALLSNLSTSTANLIRTSDLDRIQHLAKRKMDEALSAQNPPRLVWLEGAFSVDEQRRPTAGWRLRYSPYEGLVASGGESLERVELESWYLSGTRRRSFYIESYRRVFGASNGPGAPGPNGSPGAGLQGAGLQGAGSQGAAPR
jgi:prepilin-type N-terminal cleavage/methylation domain-containing protein